MIKKVQKNFKSTRSQISESTNACQQQDKQAEKENKDFGSTMNGGEF